jgi:hypothetical protein
MMAFFKMDWRCCDIATLYSGIGYDGILDQQELGNTLSKSHALDSIRFLRPEKFLHSFKKFTFPLHFQKNFLILK